MKTYFAAAIMAALAGGATIAQDVTAAPSYGDVSLSAGFTPDPYEVSVYSGGPIDASETLGGQCRGFIATAPDFDLYYNAGSFPLILSANADADTTLVVNTPDGRWFCDDDSGDGFDPLLHFPTPETGLYNIWIGTYGNSNLAPATLSISELFSQ